VEWKEALVNALGGAEQISPQRAALIDLICRTRLYVDCVDRFLLAQESIVNKRKKSVLPAVEQRQRLADSLMRQLQTLGLDRIEKNAGTLPPEWITRVQPHREPDETGDGAAVPPANGTAPDGREAAL